MRKSIRIYSWDVFLGYILSRNHNLQLIWKCCHKSDLGNLPPKPGSDLRNLPVIDQMRRAIHFNDPASTHPSFIPLLSKLCLKKTRIRALNPSQLCTERLHHTIRTTLTSFIHSGRYIMQVMGIHKPRNATNTPSGTMLRVYLILLHIYLPLHTPLIKCLCVCYRGYFCIIGQGLGIAQTNT